MNRKRIIRLIVSFFLISILLYWIDLDQTIKLLESTNFLMIGLALIIATIDRVFMPVKWNILLRAKKINIPWSEAITVYYTSSFLGLFLPPTIGSHLIRAYSVSKKHDRIDIITSIVVERLFGAIALLFF